MKKTDIEQIEILPIDLPLKNPFVTALGRKTTTKNVLVILRLAGGILGYGEASSSLAIPSATQDIMMRELISLRQQLEGMDLAAALNFIERGLPEDVHPTSFSALEMALYDAKARVKGVGLYQLFGKKKVDLETSVTISAWPADMARKLVRQEWKRGFRSFKIKVGTEWDDDLRRVIGVHEAVPKAKFILDGNQGFTVPGVVEFVNELKKREIKIEFLEQPLPKGCSWEEWVVLKEQLTVPLALDESIANCQDAKDYIRRGIVDIINIKLAKSGIKETLRIMELAKTCRIGLMIGCMAESVIGLSASVHLAAGTGDFSAVDLDSAYLLKETKSFSGGYTERGPILKIPSSVKGSGVNVNIKAFSPKAKRREFVA